MRGRDACATEKLFSQTAPQVHLEAKTAQLKANIDELNAKIHAENEKASLLQQRARFSTGAGDQVALLNALAAKVTEVYVACGFDTTDIDTLDMLRQMEGRRVRTR